MESLRRTRPAQKLQTLSTRVSPELLAAIHERTRPGCKVSDTTRELLTQAIARDQLLFELVAEALSEQRAFIRTLVKVVLLNVCNRPEAEVEGAIETLEEQGLL